jgi:uncharacterized protein (TIGR00159 family)
MVFPIDWRRAVDFLILAASLYLVLRWASGARALRIALAITLLYAGVLVARQYDLVITAWILQGAAIVAMALLVIVFQPEVRRALIRVDRSLLVVRKDRTESLDRALAESAFRLAAGRVGALFVILRQDAIDDLIDSGVVLGADISAPLIESIFNKYSPLHDGAVIIEGSRISRAGAVLPLTQRNEVAPEYGTRHRAAMGLAERTDALCVVVSEERGEVTVMTGRVIRRMPNVDALEAFLENAVSHQRVEVGTRARGWLFAHGRLKLAALGLAGLIWSVALFDSGSTVRVIEVPVEFQNVPPGLDVVAASPTALTIQLRGRTWLMNSNQVNGLIARIDLRGSGEGGRSVTVSSRALELPPGINMIRVTPEAIQLRLARRSANR